jgi:hypothetical protein
VLFLTQKKIMYHYLLSFHSVLRWLLLAAALFAILRAVRGWTGDKPFTKIDDKAGMWLILFSHLQLVLGLLLYFVYSPIIQQAFSDFGAAMKNSDVRYWAVEHISVMIIAIAIIQIGRIRSKKATTDVSKHKRAAIFYIIGLLLILSRIPWDADRLLTFF